MLYDLSRTVSFTKLGHQKLLHVSNHLCHFEISPLQAVCYCVCVCLWKFILTVFWFFVLGYEFQCGETAHKKKSAV